MHGSFPCYGHFNCYERGLPELKRGISCKPIRVCLLSMWSGCEHLRKTTQSGCKMEAQMPFTYLQYYVKSPQRDSRSRSQGWKQGNEPYQTLSSIYILPGLCPSFGEVHVLRRVGRARVWGARECLRARHVLWWIGSTLLKLKRVLWKTEYAGQKSRCAKKMVAHQLGTALHMAQQHKNHI